MVKGVGIGAIVWPKMTPSVSLFFNKQIHINAKCSPIKSLTADGLDKQVRLVFDDNYRIKFLSAL